MSFPRDIDDIPTGELAAEISRRSAARMKGLCDYCGREANSEPSCRYPDRHHFKRTPSREQVQRKR